MLRTLFVVSLTVLTACTSTRTGTPRTATLIVGETQEPSSLNPLLLQGAMSELIGPTVFSSLITIDANGQLTPDLATRVPSMANGGISRDGLTVAYHLRKGVLWQDGAPLTASDVVFTYREIMNPQNNVQSRTGYDEVASVEAVNAQTVLVRLKRPYAPILSNFFGPDQNYEILPRHVLAKYGNLNQVPYNEAPLGSGPYAVTAWRRGEELVLHANPRYFRGKPAIEQIRLRFVPDYTTLLAQLQSGEVDAVFDAEAAYRQQYASLRNASVIRTPINGTEALVFNTADPVMRDVRVRRAIVEGLDRSKLARDATRGAEDSNNPGRGFFSWAYDPSIRSPQYSPSDANRLLDAAGWRRGRDGMRERDGTLLNVQVAFINGFPDAERAGLIAQEQLRALGVALTLRKYSPMQFAAPAQSGGIVFGGRFQIALMQILSGIDPNTGYFFGCDQMPPRGFNLSRYCNSRIQAALDADARSYDPAARKRYSAIVQKEVAQAVPFAPLWSRHSVSVYPSWVRNVAPSPVSPYWNVWEWEAERQNIVTTIKFCRNPKERPR